MNTVGIVGCYQTELNNVICGWKLPGIVGHCQILSSITRHYQAELVIVRHCEHSWTMPGRVGQCQTWLDNFRHSWTISGIVREFQAWLDCKCEWYVG